MDKIDVLISAEAIAVRLDELADEINAEFSGNNVTVICVLKGAFMFATDMVRRLTFPVDVDFMQLSSYHATESTGKVAVNLDVGDISGKNVLVLEDIVDTGASLQFLHNHLSAKGPAKLKICTLLDNPARRKVFDLTPDFTGFVIPNKFVVGYGLDFNQKYRNLPYIGFIDGGK